MHPGLAPPPPPRRRILLALSSRDAGRRGRSVCWLWGLWLGGRQGTHGRRLAPWASLRAQGNRSVSRCAAVVSRDHEPRRRPPRPPLAVSAWDRAPAQVNRRPTRSWCCEPRPLPPPPAPGPCGGAPKQPGSTGRGRGTRRAGSSGQRGWSKIGDRERERVEVQEPYKQGWSWVETLERPLVGTRSSASFTVETGLPL